MQSGGASWWRVCYQQGLPRLDFTVQDFMFKMYDESPLFNTFGEGLFVWHQYFYLKKYIFFKNYSFSIECLIYLHVLVPPGHSLPVSLPGQPPLTPTAFHKQLWIAWGGSRKIQEGCICCNSDRLGHLLRWRRWRPNYWERPYQWISWGDGVMAIRNTCEFEVDVLCYFMWNMYAIC